MSPVTIGLIGVVVLIVLMYLRMWIALSMFLVGFWGMVFLSGFRPAFGVIAVTPFSTVSDYNFSAIPMFVFMGSIVSFTDIGADLYYAANTWIGRARGGLAMATILACGGFAAISGTSIAGALTFGKVAMPQMIKYGYDRGMATGCIAAGGGIGILIPPSMGFIVYGVLTGTSVGHLFMAGFLPGILQIILLIITVAIVCWVRPNAGPQGASTTLKEKITSLRYTWSALLLFLVVIGGIYTGVFTATEAGAIGAFGAIVIAFVKQHTLNIKPFYSALLDTIKNVSMMFLLMMGAYVFNKFMATSKLPFMLSDAVVAIHVPSIVILIIIMIVYIILGMFLDVISCIILTVPIFFPLFQAMGFDPVWIGVLIVVVMELGLITPPVGLDVFVLAGVTDTPVGTIFRGVTPFIIADIVLLAILIAVPSISLILPGMMMK